jgi:hypothetical protein
MTHKLHFSGYPFVLQDGAGASIGELHSKISGRKGELLNTGTRTNKAKRRSSSAGWRGTMGFPLSDPSFSRVYAEASRELPGGVVDDLKSLINRRSKLTISEGSVD